MHFADVPPIILIPTCEVATYLHEVADARHSISAPM